MPISHKEANVCHSECFFSLVSVNYLVVRCVTRIDYRLCINNSWYLFDCHSPNRGQAALAVFLKINLQCYNPFFLPVTIYNITFLKYGTTYTSFYWHYTNSPPQALAYACTMPSLLQKILILTQLSLLLNKLGSWSSILIWQSVIITCW